VVAVEAARREATFTNHAWRRRKSSQSPFVGRSKSCVGSLWAEQDFRAIVSQIGEDLRRQREPSKFSGQSLFDGVSG
jgi:hypothetical protein